MREAIGGARVNRQDLEACERCQLGAQSRIYGHDSLLVPAEHHIAAFHDELCAALGSTAPAFLE